MAFATADEAKEFLINKIVGRAVAERCPLSDHERWMLGFSETASETGVVVSSENHRPLDPDVFGEEFEARVADLLRQAYEVDRAAGMDVYFYDDALATLAEGDHYLSWIAEVAGLVRPIHPRWLRPFKQVGLVALLVVPALLALLIAAAGLWAVIGRPSGSTGETVGMSVMALVFAGFGTFLFALWLRERRD